jgi:hypothetical protein
MLPLVGSGSPARWPWGHDKMKRYFLLAMGFAALYGWLSLLFSYYLVEGSRFLLSVGRHWGELGFAGWCFFAAGILSPGYGICFVGVFVPSQVVRLYGRRAGSKPRRAAVWATLMGVAVPIVSQVNFYYTGLRAASPSGLCRELAQLWSIEGGTWLISSLIASAVASKMAARLLPAEFASSFPPDRGSGTGSKLIGETEAVPTVAPRTVFLLSCPIPLVLFCVGGVINSPEMDLWPPLLLQFVGSLLGVIGLIWGLRLRSSLKLKNEHPTGLIVALCAVGAPIILMVLELIFVLV